MKRGMGCSCKDCVECCANGNPGWFAPGEAEKAAAHMNLTMEEFVRRYLVIDYREGDELPDTAYVYAPRKLANDDGGPLARHNVRKKGDVVDGDRLAKNGAVLASWGYPFQHGRCVFLDDRDRCRIHPVKPLECRGSFGCSDPRDQSRGSASRHVIARKWLDAGNPLKEEWER